MALSQKEKNLAYRDRYPFRHSMSGAIHNARKKCAAKGIPFALTFEDARKLVEDSGGKCALSGIPFERPPKPGCKGPMSPSLDRIKPELGYVNGNVRVILDCLNSAKGSGTDEQLFQVCRAVVERNLL